VTRFYYSCAHEQFPPGELLRHNISGADPLAAIAVYAQSVLPALRGRGA